MRRPRVTIHDEIAEVRQGFADIERDRIEREFSTISVSALTVALEYIKDNQLQDAVNGDIESWVNLENQIAKALGNISTS